MELRGSLHLTYVLKWPKGEHKNEGQLCRWHVTRLVLPIFRDYSFALTLGITYVENITLVFPKMELHLVKRCKTGEWGWPSLLDGPLARLWSGTIIGRWAQWSSMNGWKPRWSRLHPSEWHISCVNQRHVQQRRSARTGFGIIIEKHLLPSNPAHSRERCREKPLTGTSGMQRVCLPETGAVRVQLLIRLGREVVIVARVGVGMVNSPWMSGVRI